MFLSYRLIIILKGQFPNATVKLLVLMLKIKIVSGNLYEIQVSRSLNSGIKL